MRVFRADSYRPQFDFIDVDQFHSRTCGSRASFAWLWTTFIIAIAVYVADVYTLVALLASNRWAGQILQTQATESDAESQKHILLVPFRVGSAFLSLDLLPQLILFRVDRSASGSSLRASSCLSCWRCGTLAKPAPSSKAATSRMRSRTSWRTSESGFRCALHCGCADSRLCSWYALRSYNHHCFFSQINKSKKRKDSLAFFVFFTFKGQAKGFSPVAAVRARVA